MDNLTEFSKAEIITSKELICWAKDIANQYGSTVEGFGLLRSGFLKRVPDAQSRKRVSEDPAFTRLSMDLFNHGLKDAGIEDEMMLIYHFTSENGMRKI